MSQLFGGGEIPRRLGKKKKYLPSEIMAVLCISSEEVLEEEKRIWERRKALIKRAHMKKRKKEGKKKKNDPRKRRTQVEGVKKRGSIREEVGGGNDECTQHMEKRKSEKG